MAVFSFLCALFWLGAAAAVVPAPADWTLIVPQATTEAELTKIFGPPDEVVAVFPWNEWSAKWKKRPISRSYLLRYTRQGSRSTLLEGPAGPADDVEVHVSDKKVIAVEWSYGGPTARAAAARIRVDAQLENSTHEGGIKASKDTTNGWLSLELADDDSMVRILFQMK